MAAVAKKTDKKSINGKSPEEILSGFNALRNEQRGLANKLSELTLDANEHRMVIETLQKVDAERKCFRMIGGILTERKVKDVLPLLKENNEQLALYIEKLGKKLEEKGIELNEFKEKYNIRIGNQKPEDVIKEGDEASASGSRGNVLVS